MLFATNRLPRQSARSPRHSARRGFRPRRVSFDLQNTTASQNMYFCERHGVEEYTEIGSQAFFQRLKDLPEKTQVLLYIHGFNNTGEAEVFPNAAKLQQLIDQLWAPDKVLVVPLIWPCDDDSVLAFLDDYWDDQSAADASGRAFARMLGKFDDWRRAPQQVEVPCMRRINVLAHSMGNRVLRNALKHWARNYSGGKMPQLFRNTFMVAADVVNHTLEPGRAGEYISDAARNVVVYYANDDLAMPASKVANVKNRTVSRRLGMTGPEDLGKVARNVHEVDCDDFNNSWDRPKGHSYYLQGPGGVISPALEHMVRAIDGGRVVPAQRHHKLERP